MTGLPAPPRERHGLTSRRYVRRYLVESSMS